MSDKTELAKKLKSDGKTYREIGEIMGVSRQRVQQLILPQSERKEAMKNSDGTCDICGKDEQSLHAHHEDYNESPKMLLCTSCHRRIHSKHGDVKAAKLPKQPTSDAKLIMRDPDGTYRRLLIAIAKANGYTTYADGLRIATDNETARIERKARAAKASEDGKK